MGGGEWRPARWTSDQLEERRMAAAAMRRRGRRGLRARPRTGRPPRLDARAWTRLGRLLARGAVAAGFETERWTLRRIAALVQREFGLRFHPRYLERPLNAHGVTAQRPATRAKERDERAIAAWPRREWVALKKAGPP